MGERLESKSISPSCVERSAANGMTAALRVVLSALALYAYTWAFDNTGVRGIRSQGVLRKWHPTHRSQPNALCRSGSSGVLRMSENTADESNENEMDGKFDPQAWLNPNTRGGVIVWSLILVTIPYLVYEYFVSTGLEPTKVGGYIGAIFVLLSNVLWASTYIFRVANKDMTYAKQLRDYENAVLQKRLEELDDDEIDALLEEIEEEDGIEGGGSHE